MIRHLERLLFGQRPLLLLLFVLGTTVLGFFCTRLRIDVSFEKLLPKTHPFTQTYLDHAGQFGGANRVLIAVRATNGNLLEASSLLAAKRVSDRLDAITGVDQSTITSIFTANTRYYEITEDGFDGGTVMPNGCFLDYKAITKAIEDGTPLTKDQQDLVDEGLIQFRENIIKSGQIGRLISPDFSAVLIRANLSETSLDGGRLDYLKIAEELESEIRGAVLNDTDDIDIHIIGFAKSMGDVADGAGSVVFFFGIAILITIVLVFFFTHSLRLTLLPVICSLIAVCWNLGILPIIGLGLDPMSLLVPFLVFAIGVSHGVQMINGFGSDIANGADSLNAARGAFRRLVLPGTIALVSDTIGFLTIWLIDIPIIQELAITASIGVVMIVCTNLILLPILLSYVKLGERYQTRRAHGSSIRCALWDKLARCASPKAATFILAGFFLLTALGYWQSRQLQIGDLKPGVPELRQSSRYNKDTAVVVDNFSIGVDVLNVIVETVENACISNELMQTIDQYQWELANVPGVQSTLSLPQLAAWINAGNFQGGLKWRTLSRDPAVLMASQQYIETSTGLRSDNCDTMNIMVFLEDHKAETLERVTDTALALSERMNSDSPKLRFRLAAGNAGVMAATNEVVQAAQSKIMLSIYIAILLLCLLTFRSLRATLCIVIPLGIVSILSYALMSLLGIGLKISTLPVAALGAGIGVDYGIYIFSRLRHCIKINGGDLQSAYRETLEVTGNAVLVTGLTLAIGVSTWIFSALKFQADMGILLTFMFVGNMLGALLLLPALARLLLKRQ